MKNFFKTVVSSVYNPTFYTELREKSLGSVIWYFFRFTTLLAFIASFCIGIVVTPFFSAQSLRKVASIYPVDLSITISKGVLSTNLATEPFFVTNPSKDVNNGKVQHKNIAVIDTQNPFSLDLFEHYDTNVLAGKDYVAIEKTGGSAQVMPLKNAIDMNVTQSVLFGFADKIGSHRMLIGLGIFLLLFLVFVFIWFVGHLFDAIFWAFLVWLLCLVRKIPATYGYVYKITVHALTAVVLVGAFELFGLIHSTFVFGAILLLVVAFINLKKPEAVLDVVSEDKVL